LFFGYSYYGRRDESKLLLMARTNGLHALSSETGEDVWWVKQRSKGGATPCVDQEEGVWKSRPFLERFGYDRLTDVEHAAENVSYNQPMMVVIDPRNPQWAQRCRRATETMTEYFLSKNERGNHQFRSDFLGFDPRTGRPDQLSWRKLVHVSPNGKQRRPAPIAFHVPAQTLMVLDVHKAN